MPMNHTIAPKDVRAIAKRQLKRTYPEVSFTGGAQSTGTITFDWTDGPSVPTVEALLAWTLPIGLTISSDQVHDELTAAAGTSDFRLGTTYVHTNRSYTREAWDAVAAEIYRQHRIHVDRDHNGVVLDGDRAWDPNAVWLMLPDGRDATGGYWSTVARNWLRATSLPALAVLGAAK